MSDFYTDPWDGSTVTFAPSDYTNDSLLSLNNDWSATNSLVYNLQNENTDYYPGLNSNPAPTAGTDFSWQSAVDYGLKTASQLVGAYGSILGIQGKAQDAQFGQYLKGAQIDIMKTQVASQADIAKIRALTDANIAKISANAAGSGANLAALGGSQSSLMLYLTIAGLVFTFIQVIKK